MTEFRNPTSRRDLLKLGGLGLAGAAFLAACSDSTPVGISGGTPPSTEDAPVLPVRPATEAQIRDADLQVKTMASLAALTARVYREQGSKISHDQIGPLTGRFATAHDEAAAALQALSEAGGTPEANPELDAVLVQPRLKMLSTETGGLLSRGVMGLLRDLESTLTASYIEAVNVVLEPEVRKALMAYGGASARRVTLLSGNGEGRLPEALYPPTDLVPGSVLVDESDADDGADPDAEGDGAEETDS